MTVIISGNRPVAQIAADRARMVAIDGRLPDLKRADLPANLVPLISDRWTSQFRWRGRGPMPEAERTKLRAIVRQAHQQGRQVRFWATPDRPEVWRQLRAAGVDLINTDDLDGLQQFLGADKT